MLSRPYRIPSPTILSILHNGKRLRTGSLEMVYQKSDNPASRFAFIVGRSVDKRATTRNRARRLVSESVRLFLPSISAGWDVVFVVRSGFMSQGDVRQPLKDLLERAHLLTADK